MAKPAPPLDTKTEIAQSRAVPAGRIQLEPVGIPVDAKETIVSVSRQGWPDLGNGVPVMRVEQYFSFDGGATWTFGGASQHAGGQARHWSGKATDACQLGLSGLPQEKNPNRQIRVEIIPVIPLTAKVDLECRSQETIPQVRGFDGRADG
jgi:hypothetical protein